jgi:hypothetical protein
MSKAKRKGPLVTRAHADRKAERSYWQGRSDGYDAGYIAAHFHVTNAQSAERKAEAEEAGLRLYVQPYSEAVDKFIGDEDWR